VPDSDCCLSVFFRCVIDVLLLLAIK
jgi:hypothetical protein